MLIWWIRRLVVTLTGVCWLFLPALAQDRPAGNGLQDIILVLDNSGSMKKNDPTFLTKAAVKEFVQQASASMSAAIIVFDSDAKLVVPLTPLSEKQSHAVLSGLDQIDYRGLLTNTPAAMERAIYELKLNSRPGAAKFIILLTDGIIDTGNPAKDSEAGKWLREALATDAARHEITFFGVALTDKADFQLLQSLAVTTEGDYFRARKAEEIIRIFERIRRLIGPPTPTAAPPNPESSAHDTKEMPAFVTLEVMGKESPEADPAEAFTALEPSELTDATAPTLQGPARSELFSRSRLAWTVALTLFVGLGVASWRFAWRRRTATPSGGPVAKPSVSAEIVPSAYLHDLSGVTGQKHYALSHPVTVVGRVTPDPVEQANSVIINDAVISRRHALIEYKHHSFWVTDQKSSNGTFVNGQRISQETRLRHGDCIRFHRMEFQFELAASSEADETCFMGAAPAQRPSLIAKAR